LDHSKLSSVMTKPVQTVADDEPLLQALRRMAEHGLSCLVVLQNNRPVGILTERDVVRLFAGEVTELAGRTAGDAMSPRVFAVHPELSLPEAGRLMQMNGCRRFPVVNRTGRLVGLVTQTDILRGNLRALEVFSRELERTVETRTADLKRKNEELEKVSVTDPLTGLFNRRFLRERIEEELARSRRSKLLLGCTLVDIDHFKTLNDTYGHEFGDVVLRGVAQCLRKAARKGDVVARYGGDEFVVIGQTDQQGRMALAERIRESVGARPFRAGKTPVTVTVSAGVGVFDPQTGALQESEELLKAADAALYEAKAQGRNRTECHRNEASPAAPLQAPRQVGMVAHR
jgi:diguanylate cyclase (GGDEF)-like protein